MGTNQNGKRFYQVKVKSLDVRVRGAIGIVGCCGRGGLGGHVGRKKKKG